MTASRLLPKASRGWAVGLRMTDLLRAPREAIGVMGGDVLAERSDDRRADELADDVSRRAGAGETQFELAGDRALARAGDARVSNVDHPPMPRRAVDVQLKRRGGQRRLNRP